MWPGFTHFIDRDVSSKDKLSYLNFIWHNENLEFLNGSDSKVVSETILKWFLSPLTRYESLMLWHVALEKSHLYLNNWGKILQACMQLTASRSIRRLCLKILNQMVLKYGLKTEFVPAFQRFMPDLIPKLLKLEDNEELVLSFESLVVCIKYLPELSGPFKEDIEAFLVNHLENESIEVVEALADCFAIFPNCLMYFMRPKRQYPRAWTTMYLKAVNTLESLFEDILLFHTGSNGPRPEKNEDEIFKVPCSLEGGTSYLCHKVRVFSSLGRSLAKLICSESPGVQVYLEDFLELIRRVISFPEEAATRGMDQSLIILFFPKMCQVAFMLLEAIVLNFSVVEHTDNILEVALGANAQRVFQAPLYNSEVQLSTWKFLKIWMKQCGCIVSCKIVSDRIVGQLEEGIKIPQGQHNDSVLIKQLCTEALKVLNALITSACSFFSEKRIKSLTTTILKIVRSVQFHSYPLKSFPYPYSDDTCRIELYNLLLTCCVNEYPFQKTCIIRSVNLFKLAQKDPCTEVTNLCHQAVNKFVHYLNPKKPPPDYTLPIPIEAPQMGIPNEEVDAGWDVPNEGNWRQEQLNGQPALANNVPAPVLYQEGGVYQGALADNENSQERAGGLDSPPLYVELGPSNQYNNVRTSRNSSLSEDLDESESDEENEDRENSINNRPCNRVQNKRKHTPISIPSAQKANRPNIQILEALSATSANEARSDEDSSDANVTVIRDVQSDQNSMEEEESPMASPKRATSENGGAEESDEEEEGFDEEDDEVEEEEDEAAAGDFANEERFSPEPEEERPVKKQKLNSVDEMSSEEDSNRPSAECEEVVSSEDLRDEIDPEVNGKQGETAKKASPTVEEMIADFVLEEAVDS